jgi:hypothetical protein
MPRAGSPPAGCCAASAGRPVTAWTWPSPGRRSCSAPRPPAGSLSASAASSLSPPPRGVLTGLDHDNAVVLVAAPGEQLLIVHPQQLVAGLLADYYVGLAAGQPDDR